MLYWIWPLTSIINGTFDFTVGICYLFRPQILNDFLGLNWSYCHVYIHSSAYLWLICIQWIGQTPPAGSWSSENGVLVLCFKTWWQARNSVASSQGVTRLINLISLIFLQIRKWNVFSDSALTMIVLISLICFLSTEELCFQGENTTQHLLFFFSWLIYHHWVLALYKTA